MQRSPIPDPRKRLESLCFNQREASHSTGLEYTIVPLNRPSKIWMGESIRTVVRLRQGSSAAIHTLKCNDSFSTIYLVVNSIKPYHSIKGQWRILRTMGNAYLEIPEPDLWVKLRGCVNVVDKKLRLLHCCRKILPRTIAERLSSDFLNPELPVKLRNLLLQNVPCHLQFAIVFVFWTCMFPLGLFGVFATLRCEPSRGFRALSLSSRPSSLKTLSIPRALIFPQMTPLLRIHPAAVLSALLPLM